MSKQFMENTATCQMNAMTFIIWQIDWLLQDIELEYLSESSRTKNGVRSKFENGSSQQWKIDMVFRFTTKSTTLQT